VINLHANPECKKRYAYTPIFYSTGKTVMGDFQRSRSKVWWSNYLEADPEDDRIAGWGGAGPVFSPSRGSSSSPSSSHKSQDSGFSDSEASSTPAGTAESFKPSPLASQEPDRNVSPVQDSQEVTRPSQECECPQAENIISEETSRVRPNSPASKQKVQLFSQCACFGQTSRDDIQGSATVSVEGQVDSSPELPHRIVQCPTQLPVTKLREKFLQDCICLNQSPESNCVPGCPDNSDSDKSTSEVQTETQTRQKLSQQSSQECVRAETDDVNGQQQQEQKEIPVREIRSIPEECVNSTGSADECNLQTQPQSSLNRSVPVPVVRTSKHSHKESPSKSVRKSPVALPRSLKNECLSHSPCNGKRLSSRRPSGEVSNNFHSPPKQTNETPDLSDKSVSSKDCSGDQETSLENTSSDQSSGGERNVCSPRTLSDPEESPSVKPLCSELPEQLGSPAHTSTPKTSAATPSKLLVTPNRPLRCLGSGKKHGRPVNLLNNFIR
jgi:hypothetical protein